MESPRRVLSALTSLLTGQIGAAPNKRAYKPKSQVNEEGE